MKRHFFNRASRSVKISSVGALCGVALLASCGDKKDEKTQTPELPKRELIVATPEQRAEKLGLMALVPQDAAMVMAVYDMPYFVDSVKNSNLGQFLASKGVPMLPSDDVEVVDVETEVTIPENGEVVEASVAVSSSIPVKDVIIAMGASQVEAYDILMKDYMLWMECCGGKMQLQGMTGANADPSAIQKELFEMLPKLKSWDLIDFSPAEGCPPLLIAAELSDEILGKIKSSVNQVLPVAGMFTQGAVSQHNGKYGEIEYTGVAIDGQLVAKMLDKQAANLGPAIPAEVIVKVKEGMSKGKLYILLGYQGNTMIAAICTNPEKQLALPANAADSILGKLDFADQYIDKKSAFACYFSAGLVKALLDGQVAMSEMAGKFYPKLISQFAEEHPVAKKYPESKDYAASLGNDVAALYNELAGIYKSYDSSQAITYYGWYDQGLAIEAVSGDVTVYDWENSAQLSAVCDMPDVVFAGAASVADWYTASWTRILEHAGSGCWSALQWVNVIKKDNEFAALTEQIGKTVPMIKEIWAISKDASSALGNQYALVVDMKGTLPKMELTEKVAEKGNVPRLAMVQTLKDRSKLEPAWEKMINVYNKFYDEMGQPDLKIKEAVKEEQDGYTSYMWDYVGELPEGPVRMINQIYMHNQPATTVSDQLYIGGSAKALNYEVAKYAKPAATVSPAVYGPLGLYMKLDIQALNKAAAQWAETGVLEDDVVRTLDATTSDIKDIRGTVSKENGKVYYRLHIRTK